MHKPEKIDAAFPGNDRASEGLLDDVDPDDREVGYAPGEDDDWMNDFRRSIGEQP